MQQPTTLTDITRNVGGRPNLTPAGRDQLQELTHLRAWYRANKGMLPSAAAIGRLAGVNPDYVRDIFTRAKAATSTLDKLYLVLEKFGYQSLPAQALTPAPVASQAPVASTGGATFDWFNPLANQA